MSNMQDDALLKHRRADVHAQSAGEGFLAAAGPRVQQQGGMLPNNEGVPTFLVISKPNADYRGGLSGG